jgi:hypothetical protein
MILSPLVGLFLPPLEAVGEVHLPLRRVGRLGLELLPDDVQPVLAEVAVDVELLVLLGGEGLYGLQRGLVARDPRQHRPRVDPDPRLFAVVFLLLEQHPLEGDLGAWERYHAVVPLVF